MPSLSVLAKLRALLAREAPEQASAIRQALARTAQTGREHSVVGAANEGGESVITRGTYDRVTPNATDVKHARRAPGKPAIVDFHTHPIDQATSAHGFDVRPSPTDLDAYRNTWPSYGQELRTLIASPSNREAGARSSAYNFFATDNPDRALDPAAFESALLELQFAARPKGQLRALADDPMIAEFMDYGGDLGDLLGDMSPLFFMRHKAQQGVGRHELELAPYQLSPNPDNTNIELWKRAQEPAIELLRAKGFAQGGLAQVKECSCGR